MVYRGPSRGCHTCKRRRVKCDEQHPFCKRCLNGNIPCEGYEQKSSQRIIFKDQTKLVQKRSRDEAARGKRIDAGTACLSLAKLIEADERPEENLALCSFFHNIIIAGRNRNSDRGFLDCIVPLLFNGDKIPVTKQALTALALGTLRSSNAPSSHLYRRRLNQAFLTLREALESPSESRDTDVLLATLLLQFDEDIQVGRNARNPTVTHQDGALALVQHRGIHTFRSEIDQALLHQVRYLQVATAIRQCKTVSEELFAWCDEDSMSRNPSSDLDELGMKVANIQHSCAKLFEINEPEMCKVKMLFEQALVVDTLLQGWPEAVPSYWQPLTLTQIKACSPPIMLYQEGCDIYPSAQIAFIWNTFRLYRIIVLGVLLRCSTLGVNSVNFASHEQCCQKYLAVTLQDLLDDICNSVPFHLGNRVSIDSHLLHSQVEFPSYQQVKLDSVSYNANDRVWSREDEHQRHVVAQGTWLIWRVLRDLADLLGTKAFLHLTHILHPVQMNWIRDQLIRSAHLLNV